jgi:O-antigen ligase
VQLKAYKEWLMPSLWAIGIIGWFFSRAILSISVLSIGAACIFFIYKDGLFTTRNFWKLLLPFILLVVPNFLALVIHEPRLQGVEMFLQKLPLVVLPISLLVHKTKKAFLFALCMLWVTVCCISSFYSFFEYYSQIDLFNAQYKQAQVLPVLPIGDHIRLSMGIVLAILFLSYFSVQENKKSFTIIALLLIGWFVIYLHLLASKTGLLFLYIALPVVGYCLLKLKTYKKWLALLAIPVTVTILYFTLPTLRNRIDYITYEAKLYSKNIYTEGQSDGMRYRSLLAGWKIFRENQMIGIGFAQIKPAMNNWYQNNLPQAQLYERIAPSNNFLQYMLGIGWLGLLSLLLFIYFLFSKSISYNYWYFAWMLPFVLSLLFEIHFEAQLGVFIFSFAWAILNSFNAKKIELKATN